MSKPVVVLATRNAGKVRELAQPLARFGLEVLGLDAFPGLPEVDETGSTYAANALLKAAAVAEATGLTAMADDSGLSVEALEGAPGVCSARYWRPGDRLLNGMDPAPLTPDERNLYKLLHALEAVPENRRGAAFHCGMCAVHPEDPTRPLQAEGKWQGRVLFEPRGTGGFGYDPVFLDPELGCSAAEMSAAIKMSRSHRAKALQAMLQQWEAFWHRKKGQ